MSLLDSKSERSRSLLPRHAPSLEVGRSLMRMERLDSEENGICFLQSVRACAASASWLICKYGPCY